MEEVVSNMVKTDTIGTFPPRDSKDIAAQLVPNQANVPNTDITMMCDIDTNRDNGGDLEEAPTGVDSETSNGSRHH